MEKLLFCLGVTKGGTTWFHWSLSQHPDIARIPRKEIHYFLRQYGGTDRLTDVGRMKQFMTYARQIRLTGPNTDHLIGIEGTDPDEYGSPWDDEMRSAWAENGPSQKKYRGFVNSLDWYKRYLRGPIDDAWYESLFDRTPPGKWPIDFSTTNYLVGDRGIARMAGFADDARAIIILRDPIERLWSHVKFHAEITGDIDRLPNWSVDELRDFIAHFKLHRGSLYANSIRSMLHHFPQDRRMIVNFEDIRTRPDDVYSDVLNFMDLPQFPRPKRSDEEPKINASAKVKMPSGAFANLAPSFVEDLEQLVDMGIDFAKPWIENAKVHAEQQVAPPPVNPEPPRVRTGLGILARKVLKTVK